MATTIKKLIEYIPKEEREDSNPTKFIFKQLLVNDLKDLQGYLAKDDNQSETVELISQYLVGWENVINEDGGQVYYSKEVLGKMPVAFIGYLVDCMLNAMQDSRSQFKKK